MSDSATRYLGNCQFCEGDFKVVPRRIERVNVDGEIVEQPMDGSMVHHGYKRPGYGYIVGDCPGVDEKPYEVSCDALKSALGPLRESIAALRIYLRRLHQDGEIDELHELDWQTKKLVTHRKADTQPYEWKRHVERAISGKKSEVAMAEKTLERFEQRIAAWKPKFIRTIEEERVKREVLKKQREDDMAARRRVKEEKRATIDAKHAAAAKKKQDIVDDGIAQLKALAAVADPKANRWKAGDVLRKLSKKLGWSHYKPHKWGIDRVLIDLGVAHYSSGGYLNVDQY